MANIVVDGTIGANRLLILDSTGKIPAVDGSQVTAIAAGNIATGTIPIARVDTGTTANKIVVLDGSGRLPAVSAALITNIPGATKSASDPVIATNPSGVLELNGITQLQEKFIFAQTQLLVPTCGLT